MNEKRTDGICRVCGGWIIERSHIPYKPKASEDIIGPGSENIATEEDRVIVGYHCQVCRIEYYDIAGL